MLKGRLGRKDFWKSVFPLIIIYVVFSRLIVTLSLSHLKPLTSLLLFIVGGTVWSVSVRRLHDFGKSGWYWLLNIIPIVNVLLIFWIGLTPGDKKDNSYGSPPDYSKGFFTRVFKRLIVSD